MLTSGNAPSSYKRHISCSHKCPVRPSSPAPVPMLSCVAYCNFMHSNSAPRLWHLQTRSASSNPRKSTHEEEERAPTVPLVLLLACGAGPTARGSCPIGTNSSVARTYYGIPGIPGIPGIAGAGGDGTLAIQMEC